MLDEHMNGYPPIPIPLGGTIDQWEAYWEKALEIVGEEYDEEDIFNAGYYITEVEEVVGDQVMFRDSNDEMRLTPGSEVITREQAPNAFEMWLQNLKDQMEGQE